MTYYVRVATRGSAQKGTPRQALNYITDGHDARRDASYSDAELHYIARMDPGWKTDLEGGRVPLVGFGVLAGERDETQLAARFEDACQPYHDIRGTTGYKSITLTVPKEVSLYAEGHREEAKAAINAAVQTALDRAFPGLRYSAVAAIHTRNQVGGIHYHVHVLVGKFAEKVATGRTVSLSSKAGGNTGRARLNEMKLGWQEGIDKEFRERLNLGIEQRTPRSPVALVLPYGSRLEPLNRESRRLLEKQICPAFTETTPSGETITRHFRWSAMDDRIFEIASGARGASSWDLEAFKEHFPEQARYAARYETRVRSLQAIGYLSPEGKISPAFRVHFAAHHGVLTPELQRVRLDIAQKFAREKAPTAAPFRPDQFWAHMERFANIQRRIQRLGYTREEVSNILARAQARKPSRENLQLIRATAEKKAALAPAPKNLPQTKTIIRAYVALQESKVQRIYLITSGVLQFWKFSEKRALAAQLKRVAERDLFYAKEKRLAQIGRVLRPVIWLVRVTMPREARRLDQATVRCARLAQQQQIRKAGGAETQKAYEQWRENFVKKPLADLKKESQSLQRPTQQPELQRLEQARQRIRTPEVASAADHLRRGYAALLTLSPKYTKSTDCLKPWVGKEENLVDHVLQQSKGQSSTLTNDEYAAAVRVGRVGHLLALAETCGSPTPHPQRHVSVGERRNSLGRHWFDSIMHYLTMFVLLLSMLSTLRSVLRTRADLALENLALRQQLANLRRMSARPRLRGIDRAFWLALSRLWSRWADVLVIVKPDTVVRWHRAGFRLFWRWKSRSRTPAESDISAEVKALIRQMAEANVGWGAPRIHGELLKLGIDISERSVSRFLPPKPRKPPSQNWRTFLDNHLGSMASIDFLTVPTATFHVLYIFLVLSHDRRRVVHWNVTSHPGAQWTAQQIVEAFPEDTAPKYMIRDRDGIYGEKFHGRVEGMGIEQVLTAPRSPWQNPYAERLVGSVRRECLDHVIVLGERHLYRILKSFFAYYHRSRTHLSLGKDAPEPRPIQPTTVGKVVALPEVGGLHHRYERLAA